MVLFVYRELVGLGSSLGIYTYATFLIDEWHRLVALVVAEWLQCTNSVGFVESLLCRNRPCFAHNARSSAPMKQSQPLMMPGLSDAAIVNDRAVRKRSFTDFCVAFLTPPSVLERKAIVKTFEYHSTSIYNINLLF